MKKTLREDQKKSVSKVIAGFKKHDRGQLILPCGTGKTLCGIHIVKRLKPKKFLMLVPKLVLVRQMIDDYAADYGDIDNLLIVCSDKDRAVEARLLYGMDAKVTTDPEDIRKALNSRKPVFIVSTYASSCKIAEAYSLGRTKSINLAIFDEAHKTCGNGQHSVAVKQDQVKISKRLFMTATPRIISESRKGEATELSMDDESDYGPEFHRMPFSEAIELGILADYRVVIFPIREESYNTIEGVEGLRSKARTIGILKAISKYDLKKTFTFHSSVKGMREFQENAGPMAAELGKLGMFTGKLWNCGLAGSDPISERLRVLSEFERKSNEFRAICSSVATLTEGFNCPMMDGIVFADKKTSVVDIVQCIGRALRKKEDGKVATIILPVMIPASFTGTDEEFTASSEFSHIWNMLLALKSYDERIEAFIDKSWKGNGSDVELPPNIQIESLDGFDISKFAKAIHTRLVRVWSINWSEIDPLLGAISDPKIGEMFDCPKHVIRRRRIKLGVPSIWGLNWLEIDPLLGTMPDPKIGKMFDCSRYVIGNRRARLGIPRFSANWDSIDPLLGTVRDAVLARQFGISKTSILNRRKLLGVSKFTINWLKVDHLLGTMPDSSIGVMIGCSAATAKKRRVALRIPEFHKIEWTEVDPLLGTMPDTKIARSFGVSNAAVRKRRAKLGIPTYYQSRKPETV